MLSIVKRYPNGAAVIALAALVGALPLLTSLPGGTDGLRPSDAELAIAVLAIVLYAGLAVVVGFFLSVRVVPGGGVR